MSVVYFARGTQSGRIKIGCGRDPKSRLYDVGVAAKEPMELLAWCDGDHSTEMQFHSFLEPRSCGGEWFHPHADVVAVVDEVRRGVFDMAKLPALPWEVTKPWQTSASIAYHGRLPGRLTYSEYRRIVPRLTHGSQKLPVAKVAIDHGVLPPKDFLEPIRTGEPRKRAEARAA